MPGRRGHLSSKMNLLCLSYDGVAFTTLLRARENEALFLQLDEKKIGSSIHPHVKVTEWDRNLNPKKIFNRVEIFNFN